MKYSREYIIRRAFDVFMNKGYDSTSISVLQEELDMSRGAMYRYFKNKEELFIAVVDEYFFRIFNKMLIGIKDDLTTSQLIEVIHRRQRFLTNSFMRAGVTHSVFLNYTALIIQAAKHYPDFLIRFGAIDRALLSKWKKSLQKGIETKEIRSDIDIDIMALLFKNVGSKEMSDDSCDDSHFAKNLIKDIEKRKVVIDYLYSLIKI